MVSTQDYRLSRVLATELIDYREDFEGFGQIIDEITQEDHDVAPREKAMDVLGHDRRRDGIAVQVSDDPCTIERGRLLLHEQTAAGHQGANAARRR